MELEKQEKSAFEKLKLKQQKFVLEYLLDLNATQAAKRAGYSKKTAYAIGSENLKKPEIKEAIKEKISEIFGNQEELILKTQRELECLSFSDIKNYINFDDENLGFKVTNDTDTRAIESVKFKRRYEAGKKKEDKDYVIEDIEFKMHNKKGSLDSLKQMLGVANKIDLNVTTEDEDEAIKAIMAKHGIKAED
jgi:phage terminase small subunit